MLHSGCSDNEQGPPKPEARGTRVVFKDAKGRQLTERDLEGSAGEFRWEVVDAVNDIPREASDYYEQGRQAGSSGKFEVALDLFQKARTRAPKWAAPVYESAWTYLLMNDFEKAEENYALVDRMEPRGFMTTKTALDSLRREREGTLPRGMYRSFVHLEWVEDKSESRRLLEGILRKFPGFPAAWLSLAGLLVDAEERLTAVEKGLACAPDVQTRGMLLLNKAFVLRDQGNRQGAIEILGTLALDPSSPPDVVHFAKRSLADLTRSK